MDIKIKRIQIVPVKPEPSDERKLAHFRETLKLPLEPVLYLVKVYLAEPLPTTSSGYSLYVGQERIQRYTEFPGGIYFNILNPQFIDKHQGETLRFSVDGETFIETESKLPNFETNTPVAFSFAAGNVALGIELPSKRAALKD